MLCLRAKATTVLVEVEIGAIGGRIGRIAQDDGDRLRHRMNDRAFQRIEKVPVPARPEHCGSRRRPSESRTCGSDSSDWGSGPHRPARKSPAPCWRSLPWSPALRSPACPDRASRRTGGRNRHACALRKPLNALGCGIAVRARVLHHFRQLLDDVLRRRQVRIAHAKINDVRSRRARLRFERLTCSNTYGGSRVILWNSSMARIPCGLIKRYVSPAG
jgi:hypothetical protein